MKNFKYIKSTFTVLLAVFHLECSEEDFDTADYNALVP